jgi:hypothetical protein
MLDLNALRQALSATCQDDTDLGDYTEADDDGPFNPDEPLTPAESLRALAQQVGPSAVGSGPAPTPS